MNGFVKGMVLGVVPGAAADMALRTAQGKPFNKNSINRIIKNRKIMKKWIAMTMLALFSVAAFAQNNTKETAPAAKEIKGTVFEKGTLKELLAKAAKEKKYLFVDVYATWCGPCKAMATQVFPQEKVGNYFNKTFVNAKFDAEKGEGIDVAKKYGVRAYPTFLILDKDGTEVGRIVGGADGDMFIEKVQEALDNIGKE